MFVIAGFYDLSRAHEKFAMMPLQDLQPQPILNFATKTFEILGIDTAVHKSEAVCWAYKSVAGDVKN